MSDEKWKSLVHRSISMLCEIREEVETSMGGADKCPPIVVTGMLGAREGGYKLTIKMTPEEAEAFHESSVKLFADDPRVDVIQVSVLYKLSSNFKNEF